MAMRGTSSGRTAASVAASVTKPAPVTPLAPFEVSGLHDDGDDAEKGVPHVVNERAHGAAALAQRHQREPEQHREQQHLQDVAARKRADRAVGDHVEDESRDALVRGARGVVRHRGRLSR
jgi:hypothetical protein